MRSFQRLLSGAHKALHGVANLDPSLPTARGRLLPPSMGEMSVYSHSTAVNDGQSLGATIFSSVHTTFLNFCGILGVATIVTSMPRRLSPAHHYIRFGVSPACTDLLIIRKTIQDALGQTFGLVSSHTYLDILWLAQDGTALVIRIGPRYGLPVRLEHLGRSSER